MMGTRNRVAKLSHSPHFPVNLLVPLEKSCNFTEEAFFEGGGGGFLKLIFNSIHRESPCSSTGSKVLKSSRIKVGMGQQVNLVVTEGLMSARLNARPGTQIDGEGVGNYAACIN